MEIEQKLNLDFIKELYFNKKTFTLVNGLGNIIHYINEYPTFIKVELESDNLDYEEINNKSDKQEASIYQIVDISENEDDNGAIIKIVNNEQYKYFSFVVHLDALVNVAIQYELKVIN